MGKYKVVQFKEGHKYETAIGIISQEIDSETSTTKTWTGKRMTIYVVSIPRLTKKGIDGTTHLFANESEFEIIGETFTKPKEFMIKDY